MKRDKHNGHPPLAYGRPRHSAVARELREDSRVAQVTGRGRTPDHEAMRDALSARESRLAGTFLDRLDREHPSYAVTLPDRYAPLPWHREWVQARRAYVTAADDSAATVALERMRGYVTMANPPLHSDAYPPSERSHARGRRIARSAGTAALAVVLIAVILAGLWLMAAGIWGIAIR